MAWRAATSPQNLTFRASSKGVNIGYYGRQWLYNHSGYACSPPPQSLARCNPPAKFQSRPFASVRSNATPKNHTPIRSSAADHSFTQQLGKAASVVNSETVPSEQEVQKALQICENLAKGLQVQADSLEVSTTPAKGPTSNLLSLETDLGDASKVRPVKSQTMTPTKGKVFDDISATAYKIVTDPKVFITKALLSTYINTQAILGYPRSFPEIFDLYAWKLAPRPGTSPIQYRQPNPNRISSAIPLPIVNTALDAAIKVRNLPLCLDIIDMSVCTTAYKRNKMFRKLTLPATGTLAAPAGVWAIAAYFASLQDSMTQTSATQSFFWMFATYVTCTSTIGYVAITSANDHMDRITWVRGTPLRLRWVREEERLLLERVAAAWGFQDYNRRGEEEGTEWEALREWAGRRYLILDEPGLMEGME